MTTLTVKENLKIKKTSFASIQELYTYILENHIDVNFHELSPLEVSPRLRAKVNRSKKKPLNV